MDGRRPVAQRPGTLLAASLLLQEIRSPGPGARGCERQPAAGDISAAGVGGGAGRLAGSRRLEAEAEWCCGLRL